MGSLTSYSIKRQQSKLQAAKNQYDEREAQKARDHQAMLRLAYYERRGR